MLIVKFFRKQQFGSFFIKATLFVSIIIQAAVLNAQQVTMLTSGTRASFRGLSVVNNNIVWVSGSNGTVGRSTNAGKTWQWHSVKGFEKTEFRDIEAFDSNTAIIMAIAEPAYILRTTDGGQNWSTVYKNDRKGMFLDAVDFYNEKYGMVVGDPLNGKFYIAVTENAGKSWKEWPEFHLPVADSGEACFASSGTNIRMTGVFSFVLASGGISSNFFPTWNKKVKIPLLQGKESTGANSVAVYRKKIMLVGGDFNAKDSTNGNICFSANRGKTFNISEMPPSGYRSSVEHLYKKTWITCGLNGVDISNDDGKTFRKISSDGFHVVRKAKKGKAVFLAGGGGRVAWLQ